MPARHRQLIELAGFALLVASCLLALPWLSARLTAQHLQQQAADRLDRLRQGLPLWQWQPRQPHDLIAGRAFGAARLETGQTGLRVISLDGSPFDLGLRLEQPIDLRHWPRLRLRIDSERGGHLGLLTASGDDPAICATSLGIPLSAGEQQPVVDVRALAWHTVQGQSCRPGRSINMLRMTLQLPSGSWLALSDVALLPTSAPTGSPTPPTRILSNQQTANALPADRSESSPKIVLDAASPAESLLIQRDQALATWPGAVVAVGHLPKPLMTAQPRQWTRWLGLCAYVLGVLMLLFRRSHPRWLDGLACLPGPLWLLTGLQVGQSVSPPAATGFLVTLLYAGLLSWRERPADWRWHGPPTSWLIALAPLPLAIVLWLLCGHPLQALPPLHVITYFGWAALQQWLILVVLLRHLDGFPRLLGVLLSALVFALLHTPNGLLMQLCFIAELLWAWQFKQQRALLPIAVAHALCALLLEAGVAGATLRSLEVSARFFS
ncbi:MAG: CPBP family intramembrane glutamic endopeptidase [Dyella sp.]